MNEQKKQEINNALEVSLVHNFLLELLGKQVHQISLFIHWDSNPLKFKEETQVTSSSITNLLLASLKEDVLYEFISQKVENQIFEETKFININEL